MASPQRFLTQGTTANVETIPATVGGSVSAGLIPCLDPTTGTFDPTMMPAGVAADVNIVPASEAITAPALVSLYANGGVLTARNADGSTQGKTVDGYVLKSVAANASATVYCSRGIVPGWTGLTVGDAFLSATAVGSVAATGAATAGQTFQKVGKAVSATVLQFSPETPCYRN